MASVPLKKKEEVSGQVATIKKGGGLNHEAIAAEWKSKGFVTIDKGDYIEVHVKK